MFFPSSDLRARLAHRIHSVSIVPLAPMLMSLCQHGPYGTHAELPRPKADDVGAKADDVGALLKNIILSNNPNIKILN